MPPTARHHHLTPEREAEMYATVVNMLRETGYDALTMDAVAARAHCSKTTLYRRFGNKRDLVAKTLRHQAPLAAATVDTGSLAADLHALVTDRGDEQLSSDAALLRGLFRALRTEPDLANALRGPGPGQLDAMIARAVRRGELNADRPAVPYIPHLLIGGLVTHPLVERSPATGAFLRAYIDAVILPPLGIVAPCQQAG
jgi:AcrR family transcriptional regulator